MSDKNSVPAAGPSNSGAAHTQKDGLTEAQREFAKVLGELLARRWHEEQAQKSGKQDPKVD